MNTSTVKNRTHQQQAADVQQLLGTAGPFAQQDPDFQPRQVQLQMAAAVDQTITSGGTLVVEAGTGTGKTFAYLVPLVASGARAVVSTATKTLQDQLFSRDLPRVLAAMKAKRDVALLKGRQNYLCLHRLKVSLQEQSWDEERRGALRELQDWARHSRSGDLDEVGDSHDGAFNHGWVTSTTENCLGQDCPEYSDCFVARARQRAAQADLVVVNHHLLFADMALRETGFAQLLPDAEVVVLDEAHKIPDIASTFFSRSLSGQRLAIFARDVQTVAATDASDMPALFEAGRCFDHAQQRLRAALVAAPGRTEWRALHERKTVQENVAETHAALGELCETLETSADRTPGLRNCFERALAIDELWHLMDVPPEDGTAVRWLDASVRNFTLYETPVSIAEPFSARRSQMQASWVMTSATLAVDGSFEHFTRALGLGHETRLECLESPFDFATQSLLFLPSIKLEPREPGYEDAVVRAILPVLQHSRGRAFLLFTSYRSLGIVAELLRDRLEYPLLVQGAAPRSALLEQYQRTPNAILLGTATFWEGVDVRGEQLSCVVIDKLPFAVPDDPIAKARATAARLAGLDPFLSQQVPEAVMALKQGAGRLIRDVTDRGVLVICDPRLTSRGYGRRFLASLPPFPLTDTLDDVAAFFAASG